jgi:hypothetical protein
VYRYRSLTFIYQIQNIYPASPIVWQQKIFYLFDFQVRICGSILWKTASLKGEDYEGQQRAQQVMKNKIAK